MKSFIRSVFLSALFASLVNSSVFADFEKGIAAYQANNMPLAYTEFRAAAEEGHADSQFNVGLILHRLMSGIARHRYRAIRSPSATRVCFICAARE